METMEQADDGRPARRWTRQEYVRMCALGILRKEDHVELIEGEILVMSPEGPIHVAEIGAAADELRRVFGPSYWVRLGNPFIVDDHSEPQPDLLVVPGRPHDWRERHPDPEDAALVVEASNTSLNFDLNRKKRLYARARVSEYWVIDIPNECIHVFREAKSDDFLSHVTFGHGATIRPVAAPAAVDVTAILGQVTR